MMSLPGNNLHLQKIGSSKIDISMIFIEFLKIDGFVLKLTNIQGGTWFALGWGCHAQVLQFPSPFEFL